jgi:hypothetical protein
VPRYVLVILGVAVLGYDSIAVSLVLWGVMRGVYRCTDACCAGYLCCACDVLVTSACQVDEEEHSIEMHLPFVAHVMKQAAETAAETAAAAAAAAAAGGGGVAAAGGGGFMGGESSDYSVVPIMIGIEAGREQTRGDPLIHCCPCCAALLCCAALCYIYACAFYDWLV